MGILIKKKEKMFEKPYVLALIEAAILHERRAGRRVKCIWLSRWNFDNLENFLEKIGVITEETFDKPITKSGVELKRDTTGKTKDLWIEYFTDDLAVSASDNLDKNAQLLGMSRSQMIDKTEHILKNAGR